MGETEGYSDPPPPPQTAIWKCRDGREIAVKDMATPHIQNALAMLRRKGAIAPSDLMPYLRTNSASLADGVQMAFEAEFDELLKRPVSHFIDIFEAELEARGEAT